MAYNVQTDDILEVTIQGELYGQIVMSLFHFKLLAPGGPIDGLTTLNSMNTFLNVAGAGSLLQDYCDVIVTDYNCQAFVLQWITNTRRARVVKVPAVLSGTFVGTGSPPNLAVAITKQSDLAGRHGVGTLHVPGLVNANHSQGVLTAPGIVLYDLLRDQLPQAYNIAGGNRMDPVIFNRNAPVTSQVITSAHTKNTVRTMHRRTVGLGI